MTIGRADQGLRIQIEGKVMKKVTAFCYLDICYPEA